MQVHATLPRGGCCHLLLGAAPRQAAALLLQWCAELRHLVRWHRGDGRSGIETWLETWLENWCPPIHLSILSGTEVGVCLGTECVSGLPAPSGGGTLCESARERGACLGENRRQHTVSCLGLCELIQFEGAATSLADPDPNHIPHLDSNHNSNPNPSPGSPARRSYSL